MDDNTKIYLGEKAAEMIAHGVNEEIKKRATNYSLCADGDGIRIDGGFGGKIFSSDLDYSTEEQLTGKRWIDGKPIYQKTIFYEGDIKNTSNFSIQHGISDLEIIVFSFVATKRKDGFIWEQINISDGSEKARYNINENSIDILYNWDPTQYLLATIQYTKTTDTELSPVSLPKIKSTHNYSTEEQIVGTWVDGKPIYEKTYILNNKSLLKGNNIFDTIENVKIIISKGRINDYSLPYGDGGEYVMIVSSNNEIGLWSNNGFYGQTVNIILTINYIKITD